jgi:hypothetical protein
MATNHKCFWYLQKSVLNILFACQAFGTDLSEEELVDLYRRADSDGSGTVDESELAACLTGWLTQPDADVSRLIKRCPISGAELVPGDNWANMIYMLRCQDEGTATPLLVAGCAMPMDVLVWGDGAVS